LYGTCYQRKTQPVMSKSSFSTANMDIKTWDQKNKIYVFGGISVLLLHRKIYVKY
jgi:hypothetical protein